MKQFDRKVIIKISSSSGKELIIDDLHIDFAIDKTKEATPNKAKFVIYNLSNDSRGFISKHGLGVVFFAGYGKAEQAIFVGSIIKNGIAHEYDGRTWATIIDCQDGDIGLNKRKVSKSFSGKVELKTAINYLIDTMGLGRGVLNIPNKQFNNGVALSGFARDRIKELCGKERLQFSVQDGNAYIISESEPLNIGAVVVNAETGLIGSPIKTDNGIKFDCLLNPNFRIGGVVKIESKIFNGSFKVEKITMSGNNFSGNFYSTVEAI